MFVSWSLKASSQLQIWVSSWCQNRISAKSGLVLSATLEKVSVRFEKAKYNQFLINSAFKNKESKLCILETFLKEKLTLKV
jgi:hypothetical protein